MKHLFIILLLTTFFISCSKISYNDIGSIELPESTITTNLEKLNNSKEGYKIHLTFKNWDYDFMYLCVEYYVVDKNNKILEDTKSGKKYKQVTFINKFKPHTEYKLTVPYIYYNENSNKVKISKILAEQR